MILAFQVFSNPMTDSDRYRPLPDDELSDLWFQDWLVKSLAQVVSGLVFSGAVIIFVLLYVMLMY